MKKLSLANLKLDESNILSIKERKDIKGGNSGSCSLSQKTCIDNITGDVKCVPFYSECWPSEGGSGKGEGPCCYEPCSDWRNAGSRPNGPCEAY